MIIENWIGRLKEESPVFCGRVFGAAEFAVIGKTEAALTPRAYVVPLTEQAKDQPSVGKRYSDDITYTVGIVAVVKNVADATGEAAHKALKPVRLDIMQALCGWKDETMSYPVAYRSGRLLSFNNQLLHFGYIFSAHESLSLRVIPPKQATI